QEIPGGVVEERPSARRAVQDAHAGRVLRDHESAALGTASRVQRAQGVLLALPQPLLLFVVQLPQALRILAREVLVLDVARFLDGHLASRPATSVPPFRRVAPGGPGPARAAATGAGSPSAPRGRWLRP